MIDRLTPKGTRVTLSTLALEYGLRPPKQRKNPSPDRTAVVVGWSNDRKSTRILWDGTKEAQAYRNDFLDAVAPAADPSPAGEKE